MHAQQTQQLSAAHAFLASGVPLIPARHWAVCRPDAPSLDIQPLPLHQLQRHEAESVFRHLWQSQERPFVLPEAVMVWIPAKAPRLRPGIVMGHTLIALDDRIIVTFQRVWIDTHGMPPIRCDGPGVFMRVYADALAMMDAAMALVGGPAHVADEPSEQTERIPRRLPANAGEQDAPAPTERSPRRDAEVETEAEQPETSSTRAVSPEVLQEYLAAARSAEPVSQPAPTSRRPPPRRHRGER